MAAAEAHLGLDAAERRLGIGQQGDRRRDQPRLDAVEPVERPLAASPLASSAGAEAQERRAPGDEPARRPASAAAASGTALGPAARPPPTASGEHRPPRRSRTPALRP